MTSRRTRDSSKALAVFTETKADIDAMLVRLQDLSNNHFEASPDDINWGDVGMLKHYASQLRQITDSAFSEGEHAID